MRAALFRAAQAVAGIPALKAAVAADATLRTEARNRALEERVPQAHEQSAFAF